MTVTAKQERKINVIHTVLSIVALVGAPTITYAVSHGIYGERIATLKEAILEVKAERTGMDNSLKDIANRLSRIEGALSVGKKGE